MRRRGVGAGALSKKKLQDAKYKARGDELAAQQILELSKQLESFHSNLEEFAAKHKNEIKKDSKFRHQFQQMCAAIGVDPLASGKGFWSEMLGVGDFYYELGVQAIEICIATRYRNGGIMKLKELHQKLRKTRGKYGQDISREDVITACKKLKLLGTGFTLLGSGDNCIVQSVPGEITMDHTAVIEAAEKTDGKTSAQELMKSLSWSADRVQLALDYLVHEGMVWIDDQTPNKERWFWFPVVIDTES